MENVRERMPVREVRLGGEHRRKKHDVRESDGHAAPGERVAHVPRVTKEDEALLGVWLALLNEWETRIGHAPELVIR